MTKQRFCQWSFATVVAIPAIWLLLYFNRGNPLRKADKFPLERNKLIKDGTFEGKASFKRASFEIPVRIETDINGPAPSKLIANIVADIALIYGNLSRYEIVPVNSNRSVVIDEREYKIQKRIVLSGGGVKRPESHHNNFGLITQIDNKDVLVIPRQLLQEYRVALAFAEANYQIIDKMDILIKKFNEYSLDSSSETNFADIFWNVGDSNSNSSGISRSSLKFNQDKLRRPSLLSFRKATDYDMKIIPQLPEGAVLADGVVESGEGKSTDIFPLIFVNNSWRIIIMSTGG